MEKLRASIGAETSPEIEAFKARVHELIMLQFDRYVVEPMYAAGRLGAETNVLNIADPRKTVIDETSQTFGPLFRSAQGEGVRATDPLEAIAEGVGFGAFGGTRSVSAVGQIKGLPPKAAKAVRKAMKQELSSRGAPMSAGEDQELASNLIRSTLFHGRSTYVKPVLNPPGTGKFVHYDEATQARPDFRHARGKSLEFGEPTGISTSLKPAIASSGAFGGGQYARVLPLYGGSPEAQTVFSWTPSGGKVINQVYENVTRKLIKEHPGVKENLLNRVDSLQSQNAYSRLKDAITSQMSQKDFNTLLAEEYGKQGFKAILFPAQRFGEYELKVFDPKNVLMIDKRKFSPDDKTLRRMKLSAASASENKKLSKYSKMTMYAPSDLATWYKKIDLEKLIREEIGVGGKAVDSHKVRVKRAGSDSTQTSEKFFEQYIGSGDEGKKEAAFIQHELNKLFKKEELPSFSASIETSKPGETGYLEWNVQDKSKHGIVIEGQPWSKEAAFAQEEFKAISSPSGLSKADIEEKFFSGAMSEQLFNKKIKMFNQQLDVLVPHVDVELGGQSGTKYLGGDVSEDMLSKNINEISFDEMRIGSSIEPLEGGSTRPPRKLSIGKEYSSLTKKLNKQYQAGLITADELASGKKAVLSQLQKKTDIKEGNLGFTADEAYEDLNKKLNEGTLQEVPKKTYKAHDVDALNEEFDKINKLFNEGLLTEAEAKAKSAKLVEQGAEPPLDITLDEMDEFLSADADIGDELGSILEKGLGKPESTPANFHADMPSMTVGQTKKIMETYNVTAKQLAELEELAFTKWGMKTPVEIYGFIKGTLQIKESGKGF